MWTLSCLADSLCLLRRYHGNTSCPPCQHSGTPSVLPLRDMIPVLIPSWSWFPPFICLEIGHVSPRRPTGQKLCVWLWIWTESPRRHQLGSENGSDLSLDTFGSRRTVSGGERRSSSRCSHLTSHLGPLTWGLIWDVPALSQLCPSFVSAASTLEVYLPVLGRFRGFPSREDTGSLQLAGFCPHILETTRWIIHIVSTEEQLWCL